MENKYKMMKRMGLVLLIVFLISNVYAATYYVDATNGNDGNTGTSEASAWQTISKVNSMSFSPGDNILFKRGEIWREQLNVPSSGAAGNPITFGAYGSGAKPIISGADIVSGWMLDSGNVWQAAVTTEPEQVFFDGTRGTEESAKENLDAANEWYWTANVLYVYSSGGDPDTEYTSPDIEAEARNTCIYINGRNYITISGLELKYSSYGIAIDGGSDNNILDNLTISYAYLYGILIYSEAGTVSDNTVQNSTVSYSGGSGIQVASNSANTLIQNNIVHHNCQLAVDPSGGHDYTAGIKANSATNTGLIVEYNEVYSEGEGNSGARGGGIWTDTNVDAPIVRYNRVHDVNKYGIYIELTSDAQVYYNVIYGNDQGIGVRGGVGGVWGTGDSHDNKIYNNIVYGSTQEGLFCFSDGSTANSIERNLFRNNIVDGSTGQELFVFGGCENDGTVGTGNVFEYNSFGAEYASFIYWDGVTKSTYDDWETAYGGTTNSVEADPLMTNPGSDDFTLQITSPAIDAGVDVGLTTDFDGNPIVGLPDIGAYEYQSMQSSCGPADTNTDSVVSMVELMGYIADWKSGSVQMTELMTAIGEWKNGC